MTINLKENFKKLQIGKSSTYKNMTLFPIIGNNNNKNNYLCFCEEHIESGAIRVNEISQEGVVAALSVTNNTDKQIFIPDGMIFKGGYQGEIDEIVILPVFCRRYFENEASKRKLTPGI